MVRTFFQLLDALERDLELERVEELAGVVHYGYIAQLYLCHCYGWLFDTAGRETVDRSVVGYYHSVMRFFLREKHTKALVKNNDSLF